MLIAGTRRREARLRRRRCAGSREAAERGLADSQFNLAVLYENGLGVAKDDKEAYKWLLLAAKSGDEEATSRRDALKARLSEEDRAAGRGDRRLLARQAHRSRGQRFARGRAGLAAASAGPHQRLSSQTHITRPARGM